MSTTKHIVGLMEAYTAVYDDELRDELDYEKELMEDDLSFLDDLSDNELVQVMEEILSEGEYTLDECLDIFDGEYLFEAESPVRARKREAREAERRAQFQKATRPARARGRLAMQRLGQASSKAAENIRGKVGRAKTLAGGAVSAVAGGAADIKRGAQRKVQAAGEKIQRAKERVKGFLGRVGRAAKAGASAARQEFSGQAGREAEQRTQARAARRAARKAPTDTSEFERKPVKMLPGASQRPALSGTPQRPALPSYRPRVDKVSVRDITGRPALPGRPQRIAISGTPQRTALPSVGKTKKGRTLTPQQRGMQTTQQNVKLRNRLGLGEDFDYILETILEDLIQEGYAVNIDDAFEILEDLTENEFDTLVESYLEDEVETLDFYDDVLDYLVSEGYAETEEDATAIMANMSEGWRSEILDEILSEDIRAEFEAMSPERRREWSRNIRTGADELQKVIDKMLKKEKGVKGVYLGQKPKPQTTGRVKHNVEIK